MIRRKVKQIQVLFEDEELKVYTFTPDNFALYTEDETAAIAGQPVNDLARVRQQTVRWSERFVAAPPGPTSTSYQGAEG